MSKNTFILGAGITGLAAGIKTGLPIYEAANYPGGLCSSYEINGAKFERAGGHWFYGSEKEILSYLDQFSPLKFYERKAAAYFSKWGLIIPFPIQNNLGYLPQKIQDKISREKSVPISEETQEKWLRTRFGKTLCQLFFFPFEDRYTAGLFRKIVPRDKFKVPGRTSQGYNDTLAYPQAGLNDLIVKLARQCRINYSKQVVNIDLDQKVLSFADGNKLKYTKIFSTLPLNQMVCLSKIKIDEKPWPYTSVLVINVLAKKGKKCPIEHWLYLPDSQSGFHRVGFYSNVDSLFLPQGKKGKYVSIYAEKAFLGGTKLSGEQIEKEKRAIIRELTDWQFITQPEIVDPNWIGIAYCWQLPNSRWGETALGKLAKGDITQMGRYGRWCFQGMTDSIREGSALEV